MSPNPIVVLTIVSIFAAVANSNENRHPDCLLPFETGLCRARMSRWGFDSATNKCREFVWGGCGGNANSFENEDDCVAKCADKLPPVAVKRIYDIVPGSCSCKCLRCKNSPNIDRSGRGFPKFRGSWN